MTGAEIRALLADIAAARKGYYLSLYSIAESAGISSAAVALIAGADTEKMRAVAEERRGKPPWYEDILKQEGIVNGEAAC